MCVYGVHTMESLWRAHFCEQTLPPFPVQEVSFLPLLPLKRAQLPQIVVLDMLYFTYQYPVWYCSACVGSPITPFTAQNAPLRTQTHMHRHIIHHCDTRTSKHTQSQNIQKRMKRM